MLNEIERSPINHLYFEIIIIYKSGKDTIIFIFVILSFALYDVILSIEFNNVLKQVEKSKQDDALSDISDLLGELKGMAIDMGSEIER
jgi:hypothetical protein